MIVLSTIKRYAMLITLCAFLLSGCLLIPIDPEPPFSGSVAWSGEGDILAICYDNTLILLENDDSSIMGEADNGCVLAWNSQKDILVQGDHLIQMWQIEDRNLLTTIDANTYVSAMAWNFDNTKIATAETDRRIRIRTAENLIPLILLDGHTEQITSLAWSPDGKRIASASYDGTIKIWDVLSGEILYDLFNPSGAVYAISWNPQGESIISVGADGVILQWDSETGEILEVVSKETHGANFLEYDSNGYMIAIVANDKTIILEAYNNQERLILKGDSLMVQPIAWGPDSLIASVNRNGSLEIWDVETGQLLSEYKLNP